MKGHKRFRSGAWRLAVFAGFDAETGRKRYVYETVRAQNNRAGAKAADARLAQLIADVEEGRAPVPRPRRKPDVVTVRELAARWQRANRPRRDRRTGQWIGWSPKTAKTHLDNFRAYILPTLGDRDVAGITGLDLDDLYSKLEIDSGLSPALVARCHSQIRALFSWALRKKLVDANPALSADPPRLRPAKLHMPSMDDVRAVQAVTPAAFAAYVQLAATVGARRGALLALRWGDLDLEAGSATFTSVLSLK